MAGAPRVRLAPFYGRRTLRLDGTLRARVSCLSMLHGITPDDVRGAPTFPEVWRKMRPFLSDNVVAHNAGFDISCLRAALAEYRPPDAGEFDYICTLSISRRLRGRGGNHDAFEDAAVCAEIFKIFETRTNVNAFKKRFFPPF